MTFCVTYMGLRGTESIEFEALEDMLAYLRVRLVAPGRQATIVVRE